MKLTDEKLQRVRERIREERTRIASEQHERQRAGGIVGRVVQGTIGLVKSRIGYFIARPETIEARKQICGACPHAAPCRKNGKTKCCGEMLKSILSGGTCGCIIERKVTVASESCPFGYWTAETEPPP